MANKALVQSTCGLSRAVSQSHVSHSDRWPIQNGWRSGSYLQLHQLPSSHHFAQFGIPSVIVSDNGRNFTSTEFEQFLTQNGIRHLLSSPYHPSSNGLAERGVRIFKEGMSKCTEGTLLDIISHVLFYNHITPQTTTGLSPAELLQNRRLQSHLDLLKPDLQARIDS